MSAVLMEPPRSKATAAPLDPLTGTVAMMLHGVAWEEYLAYRDDPANDGLRMYYAEGDLLLMATGRLHERISVLLGLMMYVWAEHRGLPIMSCGRWTMRQQLKRKGLEPDNCYYLSSVSQVRGRQDELDLGVDPPPNLAVEVDLTTYSQHKFGIYAALKVAELWVWSANAIQVYRLTGDEYQPVNESVEFPDFPLAAAVAAILENHQEDDLTVVQAFREKASRA
jgi:Uma2 family endonuclease